MAVPVYNPNHVTEGLALLTSMFANQTNIKGILGVYVKQIQKIEDALNFYVTVVQLSNHPMAGGPWDILDKLGSIVGEARLGRDDTDYVLAIRLRIRINRSNGLAEDIIQIAALIASGILYDEWQPASWEVQAYGITAAVANALIKYLGQAKAGGTAGWVRYSLAPLSSDIVWGSTIGTMPTAKGFMDLVSSEFPFSFVSLQPTG